MLQPPRKDVHAGGILAMSNQFELVKADGGMCSRCFLTTRQRSDQLFILHPINGEVMERSDRLIKTKIFTVHPAPGRTSICHLHHTGPINGQIKRLLIPGERYKRPSRRRYVWWLFAPLSAPLFDSDRRAALCSADSMKALMNLSCLNVPLLFFF